MRVEGNGPGVPQPYREARFEKFRQVSDSLLEGKPKGTGLGLAICRQTVEHFGGRSGPTPRRRPPSPDPQPPTP